MYRKDYEAITLVLEDWFEIRYSSVLAFEPIRDDDGQIPILRFVYDEN